MINGGNQTLFDRAIIESGTAGYTMSSVKEKKESFDETVRRIGCEGASDIVACMEALPPTVLANNTITDLTEPFPIIDGVLITEQPMESLKNGRVSKVPTIVGTCTHEGTFFVARRIKTEKDIRPALKFLLPFLTEKDFEQIDATYPISDYVNDPFLEGSEIVGDRFFQCPSVDLAQTLALSGVPVYKYRWNHSPELLKYINFYGGRLGVFHFSEIAFIFSARPLYASREEYRLSNTAIDAWVSFASTGIPKIYSQSPEENATWPVYKMDGPYNQQRQNLVFQTPVSTIFTESDVHRDRVCQVWKEIESRRDNI